MKRYIYSIIIALAVVALSATSCRMENDELLSYGQMDHQVYDNAASSFEQQFISFWTAMNENYGIWDYELENGLDWDEVYNTYLPKFQEFDQRQEVVSDKEFSQLYEEIISRLHDGHLNIQVQNLSSGHFMYFNPADIRNASREDCEFSRFFSPHLSAYKEIAGDCHIAEFQSASSDQSGMLKHYLKKASAAIKAKLEELDQKETLSEEDSLIAEYCMEFLKLMKSWDGQSPTVVYAEYNQACVKYAMLADLLGIELPPMELQMNNFPIAVNYAYLDAGIAYFHFTQFYLLPYLNPEYSTYYFNLNNPNTLAIRDAIYGVWKGWFDKIQELKQSNSLKGVIIDVRSNTGGILQDFQYVLGALVASGSFSLANLRSKAGIGRFDYNPLVPFDFETYKEPHAAITEEPIVVLCNGYSVSMAELTSLATKSLPNAHLVGMRTWGGLCGLDSDPACYSESYSGFFGVENKTAFYAYLPKFVTIHPELGILEGIGVTPDVEIPFDQSLFESTGRDNQFERAVQLILNGN